MRICNNARQNGGTQTVLDDRHFMVIETLKTQSLCSSALARKFGVHVGRVQNWIDAITQIDPFLYEEDDGKLGYITEITVEMPYFNIPHMEAAYEKIK